MEAGDPTEDGDEDDDVIQVMDEMDVSRYLSKIVGVRAEQVNTADDALVAAEEKRNLIVGNIKTRERFLTSFECVKQVPFIQQHVQAQEDVLIQLAKFKDLLQEAEDDHTECATDYDIKFFKFDRATYVRDWYSETRRTGNLQQNLHNLELMINELRSDGDVEPDVLDEELYELLEYADMELELLEATDQWDYSFLEWDCVYNQELFDLQEDSYSDYISELLEHKLDQPQLDEDFCMNYGHTSEQVWKPWNTIGNSSNLVLLNWKTRKKPEKVSVFRTLLKPSFGILRPGGKKTNCIGPMVHGPVWTWLRFWISSSATGVMKVTACNVRQGALSGKFPTSVQRIPFDRGKCKSQIVMKNFDYWPWTKT